MDSAGVSSLAIPGPFRPGLIAGDELPGKGLVDECAADGALTDEAPGGLDKDARVSVETGLAKDMPVERGGFAMVQNLNEFFVFIDAAGTAFYKQQVSSVRADRPSGIIRAAAPG